MTLKVAQTIARQHGMTIRKTSAGDYRVNVKGDSESHASYESTIEDALDTAQAMYTNKHKGLKHYWVI